MRKIFVNPARAALAVACALVACAAAQTPAPRSPPRADSSSSHSQSKQSAAAQPPAAPLLTRTTTRHEVRRFGYGGTLTIAGAPVGSITVEAWPRAELEVTAEIELHANTEEDLARLAAVNNFLLDADGSHIRVLTTGTHDRKFMKKQKDFPKPLLSMPWKIDYHVRVPSAVDLEITSGRGAVSIEGVEGALQLTAGESNATLTMTGGDVVATIAGGTVLFRVPAPGWRGRGAQVRLVRGTMTVALPANFNADVDATVLRTGEITGTHDAFAPRDEQQPVTARAWHVRAGSGGAQLRFEVGDGSIRFAQLGEK